MLGTKDWTERDGEYDYIELFNKVVNLFADPEDDWAKETLDWFQKYVVYAIQLRSDHASQ